MAEYDTEFENADSGASKTYPAQCSSLRKNGFVLLKGRPCKIVDMSTSKTGKHGHAKVHMVGIDLFTGKKYEDICPSTHNMDVPNVLRRTLQLLDVSKDDGYLSLMSDNGETEDIPCNKDTDLFKDICTRFDKDEQLKVTVLVAMEEEQVVAVQNITDK